MLADVGLDQVQHRFLVGHTVRNHSEKHLAHYRSTFKYLDRFLAATRRRKVVEALTTPAALGEVSVRARVYGAPR